MELLNVINVLNILEGTFKVAPVRNVPFLLQHLAFLVMQWQLWVHLPPVVILSSQGQLSGAKRSLRCAYRTLIRATDRSGQESDLSICCTAQVIGRQALRPLDISWRRVRRRECFSRCRYCLHLANIRTYAYAKTKCEFSLGREMIQSLKFCYEAIYCMGGNTVFSPRSL